MRRDPRLWITVALGLAACPLSAAAVPAPGIMPGAPDSASTTFLIVRHAERSATQLGSDPPLGETGRKRAQALLHVMRDANVSAIYSTRFLRCRETVLPLAAHLGDSVRIADQSDAPSLVQRLRAEHPGGTVLLVGHSDTIPQIVEALSGRRVPPFASGEFDVIYVVTIFTDGKTSVMRLKYGEPSVPGS